MFLAGFVSWVRTKEHPPPSWPSEVRGVSEERSQRQHSEIEVGVLTAITGHGGSASRHRNEGNSILHHYYTAKRSENPLTYQAASHPWTRGGLPGDNDMTSFFACGVTVSSVADTSSMGISYSGCKCKVFPLDV
ncbi:hypothetical protein AVEN_189484-1 [Araneus ventricosus]|uniref:Uncharacterized protein n=1 Tax=Araneus ventricosus TaxID=182803 RepID=A0A4Y2S0T6_ARAVE|nr:hypothetical protein AVEN_189484-1 [Araneus ventricosus]